MFLILDFSFILPCCSMPCIPNSQHTKCCTWNIRNCCTNWWFTRFRNCSNSTIRLWWIRRNWWNRYWNWWIWRWIWWISIWWRLWRRLWWLSIWRRIWRLWRRLWWIWTWWLRTWWIRTPSSSSWTISQKQSINLNLEFNKLFL